MAKYQTKAKTQKVYAKNRAEQNIIPANCVAVFPMLIVSGSTYITENGTMPQNLTYDKGSFLFWQEVFDGRSSIKIQWEDATLLEKPEGKNYYLADTHVGKYYFGKPISSGSEGLEIGDDQSFDEFITMRANQSVKVRFEFDKSNRIMYDNIRQDLRFVDNDLYKLYLIPELCEGKLMYISDYEEGYEDKSGLSYWCEITFQALGNELQKSGKAVEQYPQWSAPGEFYVKPKIEYSVGDVREKRITIDQAGLHPIGVKYLQVELQGPALTSCVYALGRRQEKDPETGKWKIGPSHHLLGVNFVSTQPNPLNRTSTPTKNYDCFIDEEITFSSTKDMLENLTLFTQNMEVMKNGGYISLGSVSEWEQAKGIHCSNKPSDNNDSRFDYYDETWYPLTNFDFGEDIDYKDFDTNGCVYAEDTMRYTKSDRMIDIMNKNVFTFNQQPIIPLSMYATRPLYLRNIPLIGSIANFFSLGDIHLFSSTTNRQTSNLIYFGDADLCGICANLQKGFIADDWRPWKKDEQKISFPVNFFGNNETSYNKLGVNSVNTTLCMELTDLVNIDNTTYNTVLLGQTTYEDGTPIFPDEPNKSLLVNGSMKTQEALNTGFIIDAVIVQTIFDGKIRMSCYTDQDNEFLIPAWTTTILSNASWQGGAMRDWTNMYILSNWTDRFCRQQDQFTWPLPPHKQSAEEIVLNVNQQFNFSISGTNIRYHAFPEEWGLTLGTYNGISNSNHAIRTQPQETVYTIAYTDLAIEEITDRDSFLSYFENIQANCNQSWIKYEKGDKETQSNQLIASFNNIGSFTSGVYEYDFDCPAVSINNSPSHSWSNKELEAWCDEQWCFDYWRDRREDGKLGTTVVVRVHIKLNEQNIEISIIDKTIMVGWNMGTKAGEVPCLATLHPGAFSYHGYSASYNGLLNQVKFIKRGNGRKFPNSIYGVKGTENH